MQPTLALRVAGRTPLIRFVGKRSVPQSIDHTPRAHPMAPGSALPSSFAEYRVRAQQHGPLTGYRPVTGGIEPKAGEAMDRSELPQRFWRMPFSKEEMEIVESGGAAAFA